jgi:hypothetical protein
MLKKKEIPQSVIDTIMLEEEEDNEEKEDEPFYVDLKHINRNWEQTLTLNLPESVESFSFTEQFVSTLQDSHLRKILSEALSGQNPFAILIKSFIKWMKEKLGLFSSKLTRKLCKRNTYRKIMKQSTHQLNLL